MVGVSSCGVGGPLQFSTMLAAHGRAGVAGGVGGVEEKAAAGVGGGSWQVLHRRDYLMGVPRPTLFSRLSVSFLPLSLFSEARPFHYLQLRQRCLNALSLLALLNRRKASINTRPDISYNYEYNVPSNKDFPAPSTTPAQCQ